MKKSLATVGVTAAVAFASVTGLGIAHAATATSASMTNPVSSLVTALASKFNLKTVDVQAVFDAQHAQMEAQHTVAVKTELTQLVKDSKLTQTQADAILAKKAALEQQRETNRSSMASETDVERKAPTDAERTALDTWMSKNGISNDYRYLLRGGPGGSGGHHELQDSQSSSSSTDTSSTK